jgi:hypothetical protein
VLLATAGAIKPDRGNVFGKALDLPYYFYLVNFAATRGIISAWCGETSTVWNPERVVEQSVDEVASTVKPRQSSSLNLAKRHATTPRRRS